jgi:hypothetical protein
MNNVNLEINLQDSDANTGPMCSRVGYRFALELWAQALGLDGMSEPRTNGTRAENISIILLAIQAAGAGVFSS